MVQMQGLSLEQLADLYDASSDEVKQWMHDHSGLSKYSQGEMSTQISMLFAKLLIMN